MMRRYTTPAVVLVVIVVLWASSPTVHVQGPASLPTVTHVGVAVPDIDAALRAYSDIFGISVPDVQVVPISLPDGSQAETRVKPIPS